MGANCITYKTYKLEPLLRFDDTIIDSTDGASKDAAGKIETVHTQTKDPARSLTLQDDVMPSEADPHTPESTINPPDITGPSFSEPK